MGKLQPFLKWAGGKRQLLPQLREYYPKDFDQEKNTYFEPFLGAGAVLFDFAPKNAVINDINKELINLYKVIKDKNKIQKLINHLETHKNTEDYFYDIREWDRLEGYEEREDWEKASRFIYLNKTCYNGLYRVNSKGYFNVPFGKYKNPDYVNESTLKAVHNYLIKNNIQIKNDDFEKIVDSAKPGDFIYFDPPYDPLSKTSSFNSYQKESFGDKEQIRLRDTFVKLYNRGCYVLLSNSNTQFINDLYSGIPGVEIKEVYASRSINSKADKRGKIKEVLVVGDGRKKNKERQSMGEVI